MLNVRFVVSFAFLFQLARTWPTVYEDDDFENPLVDDVPAYFKGRRFMFTYVWVNPLSVTNDITGPRLAASEHLDQNSSAHVAPSGWSRSDDVCHNYSFVHLRAASNRPLWATWTKTAAPTWLAAFLWYGCWSPLNEDSLTQWNLNQKVSNESWRFTLYIGSRIASKISYNTIQNKTYVHNTVTPTVADHKLTNGMVCHFW